MKVTNSLAEKEAKGLIPLTTKSEKIMWMHSDIANDKQWDSSQGQILQCHLPFTEDNNATITSLSNSEEEKFALAV